jgi:hypothetical protein
VLSLKLLIVVGSAGISISLVCLIALHLLSTPVHPIRDAICDHASYRFGSLFGLQGAAIGISGVCLFAALVKLGYAASEYGVIAHLGLVALIFYTLPRLALVFFPSDVKPPRTSRGTMHMVLDVLMFIGISYASGFLDDYLIRTRVFGSMPWANMGVMLWATTVLIEACSVLTIFTVSYSGWRKFMGLNERILYLGVVLWFGAVFSPLLALIMSGS